MINKSFVECAFIGCLIKNPNLLHQTKVEEKHFSASDRRDIFKEAKRQIDEQGEADVVLMASYAEDNHRISILRFQEEFIGQSSLSSFNDYENLIIARWMKDQYTTTTMKYAAEIKDSNDPRMIIEKLSSDISEILNEGSSEEAHVSNFSMEAIDGIYKAMSSDSVSGISTGIAKLNSITGGWQDTDLIIIAGRPAMGKTTFVLNMALNAIKESKSVVVYTLEMSPVQFIYVLAGILTGISTQDIRTGRISQEELKELEETIGWLNSLELYIVDKHRTIEDIASSVRFHKRKYGVDMAIIDHLHLVRTASNFQSDALRIGHITSTLKELASKSDCCMPVVLLSQLSRAVDLREDKRPMPSDLRGSGAIEQDADIIMFLYRDSYYSGNIDDDTVELLIAKNRMGDIGKIYLRYENREYHEANKFHN